MNRMSSGWIAAISTIVVVSVALSPTVQAHLPTLGPSAREDSAASGSSSVAPALTGPIYNNVTGWAGTDSVMYLTNYTGVTYLPSTYNSSFAYQTTANSSYDVCCGGLDMQLANAQGLVVGTGGYNRSYYTYIPDQGFGWTLHMFVTDAGYTAAESEYIGPPSNVVAWAQFMDLIVNVMDAPTGSSNTLTHTDILSSWDTGINASGGGNYGGTTTTEGIDAELSAMAGTADIVALATSAAFGLDLGTAAVAAVLDLLAASGDFSSKSTPYSYYSTLGEAGGNATVNQYTQITPNPTPAPGYGITSDGGDAYYAQSTVLQVTIGTGINALPHMSEPAQLELEAYPILGDNDRTWDDTAGGATAFVNYDIEPAVSLTGTVTYYPGETASGAVVLLQQSCPSGTVDPGSANYYETTNATGVWHFFAAPGCTYTYSASATIGDQGQTLTSTSSTFTLPSSAAGTSRTLGPKNVGELVTFTETGLPSWDETWSVTMNGAQVTEDWPSIEFIETNGSHSYSVKAPSPYTASYTSPTTVNGAADLVSISMKTTSTLYSVKFTESGLPSGTSWNVCMNDQCVGSTGTSLSIQAFSGSYSWSASKADVTGSTYYAPSPASGTVSVPSTTSVSISYSKVTGGGGGCVNFGTPVLTPTGYVPVQDLRAGQRILEYNVGSGGFFVGTFLSATVTDVSHVLSINRGELVVTLTDQPIWIRNMTFEGWLHDPQNLTAGDFLFDPLTDVWIPVQSLQVLNENTHVFDVQTSVANDYIANGVLVDMKIGPGGTSPR
jgi:hypothetical protein